MYVFCVFEEIRGEAVGEDGWMLERLRSGRLMWSVVVVSLVASYGGLACWLDGRRRRSEFLSDRGLTSSLGTRKSPLQSQCSPRFLGMKLSV